MQKLEKDLFSLCENAAEVYSDNPLYTFLNKKNRVTVSISYRQLYEHALKLGTLLQSFRLEKQVVMLFYPHGIEFIIGFFACIFCGAIPAPIAKPRGADFDAISRIAKQANAKAILTTQSTKARILSIEGLRELLIITAGDEKFAEIASWTRPKCRPKDIAFIQFTSGSTLKPKGVVITHKNIMDNSERIRRKFNGNEEDTGISWLPFFHDMGFIGHIIQPLYTKIHNYFLSPVTFLARPARWLEAISTYAGSISGGPNFAYSLCNDKISAEEIEKFDLSRWRLAYSGAERILAETVARFQEKFAPAGFRSEAFYPCYGLAESTLMVTGRHGLRTNRANGDKLEYISVGTLDEDDGVTIADLETGKPVEDGEVGEIWVNSASVAKEYYRDVPATQETFVDDETGDRRRLRTGDLGFIRADNLYYVGRSKNLIKVRGSSYYAEDIEEISRNSLVPLQIEKCVAFSVQERGEDAVIVLVGVADRKLNGDMAGDIKRLKSKLCEQLGLVPHAVVFVKNNTIPLTTSGKLRREACRNRYIQGYYSIEAQ